MKPTDTQVEAPKYTDDELKDLGTKAYLCYKSKNDRDTIHSEFNNQSYIEWFRNNEIIANTFIVRDKTNKDLAVHAGTVEQKMLIVLAEINRLNLQGEVRVFDTDNQELQELGMALTDINDKTAEMEGDDEKKLMRQMELMKQGTVFIQDNWVKRWAKAKTLKGKFTGKVSGVAWDTKMEKVFDGPERNILYGPGVYLGNIREFDIKKQPYIFTLKLTSYAEAKSRYGATDKDGKNMWERWENVPHNRVPFISETDIGTMSLNGGWSLNALDEEMVEEIHFQDQNNDEYQILLNGVPMLPVGFPLSAITPNGMFNVEKQVLQVINPFFTYGRSFGVKAQQLSELLDEMIKLLLLKTRKSIHPPYANVSGKVISEKSLMPGAISMGIDPNALVPIGKEGQGATSSEYQMLEELRNDIDRATVSPQVQGQDSPGTQTAFEVNLLQQQAQKSIALILFACTLLEQKVTWLRTYYNLAFYFEPTGTKIDDVRNALVSTYRTMTKNTAIPGRGMGQRKIIPTQNPPASGMQIYNQEEYSDTPVPEGKQRRRTRSELGMSPMQILYIDVNILKNCKYIFFTEVISKPRDTSMNAKMMFREELKDLQALQQSFGASVNVEELQNEYALLWHKRKEKLFGKPKPVMPPQGPQGGAPVLNMNSAAPAGMSGAPQQ